MINEKTKDVLNTMARTTVKRSDLIDAGISQSDLNKLLGDGVIKRGADRGLYEVVNPSAVTFTRKYTRIKGTQPKTKLVEQKEKAKKEAEVEEKTVVVEKPRPIPKSENGADLTLDLENFYGLDTVWIIDQVLESGGDIDTACGCMNYDEEDTQLAHLIMARKYYSLCDTYKGDYLLYKIAPKTEDGIDTSNIASPIVKWLAEGIYRNKKAYTSTYENGKHYMLLPTGYQRKTK